MDKAAALARRARRATSRTAPARRFSGARPVNMVDSRICTRSCLRSYLRCFSGLAPTCWPKGNHAGIRPVRPDVRDDLRLAGERGPSCSRRPTRTSPTCWSRPAICSSFSADDLLSFRDGDRVASGRAAAHIRVLRTPASCWPCCWSRAMRSSMDSARTLARIPLAGPLHPLARRADGTPFAVRSGWLLIEARRQGRARRPAVAHAMPRQPGPLLARGDRLRGELRRRLYPVGCCLSRSVSGYSRRRSSATG